jgi:hypothetical protein
MSTVATETRAAPITADTILRLFPDIDTSGEALEGHDEEQIRLMDEVCIVLDEDDKPIGTASKKLCKLPHGNPSPESERSRVANPRGTHCADWVCPHR